MCGDTGTAGRRSGLVFGGNVFKYVDDFNCKIITISFHSLINVRLWELT